MLILINIYLLLKFSRNFKLNKEVHKFVETINSELNFKTSITPKPKSQIDSKTIYTISPEIFRITDNYHNSILDTAIYRFWSNTFQVRDTKNCQNCPSIKSLKIYIDDINDPLKIGVEENYQIFVDDRGAFLFSSTLWGSLHGLESLSQLIYFDPRSESYLVKKTCIYDEPAYDFRGFLIDTSRHYLPIDLIFKHIDAMRSVKLNVLHWHIVDNEAFPYVSQMYPRFYQCGSNNPRTHVYTTSDIEKVTKYALDRGIIVMLEIDTPSHVNSWYGVEEILVNCSDNSYLIDPSKNISFTVVRNLMKEIHKITKSPYIHIGGDEVDGECWFKHPHIVKFAEEIQAETPSKLQSYYTKMLVNSIINDFDKIIAWEEVLLDSNYSDSRVIINFWRTRDYEPVLKAAMQNISSIVSGCFYISSYGANWSWKDTYLCNPRSGIDHKYQHFVIGGTMCTWGEFVSSANMLQESWIPAVVIAERFWSVYETEFDDIEVLNRFEQHHCRLLKLGVPNNQIRPSFKC